MLLRLIELDGGDIRFEGRDLLTLRGEELRSQRRQMQMVSRIPSPRSIADARRRNRRRASRYSRAGLSGTERLHARRRFLAASA